MSSEGSHHDLIELLFEIGLFDGFASRGRRRVGGGEEGARVRSGPFSEKCIAVSSEELGRFGGVSGCLCDGVVVDELATGLVGAASDGGRGEEREREGGDDYFVESSSEALFATEGILDEFEELGMDVENGLDVEFRILKIMILRVRVEYGAGLLTLIAVLLARSMASMPIW